MHVGLGMLVFLFFNEKRTYKNRKNIPNSKSTTKITIHHSHKYCSIYLLITDQNYNQLIDHKHTNIITYKTPYQKCVENSALYINSRYNKLIPTHFQNHLTMQEKQIPFASQFIHLFSPSYPYYITLLHSCQHTIYIINKILTIPII